MAGTTTVVVGASGYLGTAVAARLGETDRDVVGTYCSSPADHATVQYDYWTDDPAELLDDHGADEVVFAAAPEYGGEVDTGEGGAEPEFVRAADRFARACAGRRTVYVSSAAVFDGETGGYVESDHPSPRDTYGNRLLTVEKLLAQCVGDHAILRSSYLFGFSGGALDDRLARTRAAVRAGESVAYFADMFKSPFLVSEAAAAVEALLDADATGPVHAPAPRVSVYEFHCEAMRALGLDPAPVERDAMPPDMDVAPDRSLSSERFESVVGFAPSGVREGLERQVGNE